MQDEMSSRLSTTLCSIMKDEGPYILEWVAYHRLLGFKEIVIYTNNCTDDSEMLLSKLALAGIVTHRVWVDVYGLSPQLSAYRDAVINCKTDWILFIDADEFLCLEKDVSIVSFLFDFPSDVAAIAINWRCFGSGGSIKYVNDLVIHRFTRAAKRDTSVNHHCKTIARVDRLEGVHIHRCFLSSGRYVNTAGIDIDIKRMGFTPYVEHSRAQINHYVVKSREEFEQKKKRGNANRAPESKDKFLSRNNEYFTKHDLNDETDISIQRFSGNTAAQIFILRDLMENIDVSSFFPFQS